MTSVIMTYLTIAGLLALTTFPVLVPVLITAVHAIIRRTAGPARAATYQPTVSRRLAVPTAA
jgi:ABC-type transport system involved in cytochrome c biogenesis permease component